MESHLVEQGFQYEMRQTTSLRKAAKDAAAKTAKVIGNHWLKKGASAKKTKQDTSAFETTNLHECRRINNHSQRYAKLIQLLLCNRTALLRAYWLHDIRERLLRCDPPLYAESRIDDGFDDLAA